jgi:hypothetical protein
LRLGVLGLQRAVLGRGFALTGRDHHEDLQVDGLAVDLLGAVGRDHAVTCLPLGRPCGRGHGEKRTRCKDADEHGTS